MNNAFHNITKTILPLYTVLHMHRKTLRWQLQDGYLHYVMDLAIYNLCKSSSHAENSDICDEKFSVSGLALSAVSHLP